MIYELDDLDRRLLDACLAAVQAKDMGLLEEDDFHEAVQLLVATNPPTRNPRWPHRCNYLPDLGYVVWRDVFEGKMQCSLDAAIREHRAAVFVQESEAEEWCKHRNAS